MQAKANKIKASSVKVPYADLGLQARSRKKELLTAFERVLDSGQYILGPSVAQFEKEFAAYCGTRYALGLSNGTSALILTFRALGIGPGDEVITAPNSFIASASSIALAGGKPVFADIGKDMNLDPASVERAITKKTKGILPVHLAGRPAKMKEILELAKRRGLFVVEDAAQAVGAKLSGKRVGGWGKAACFSLHPLKNLHAFGDGGMVTTDDTALYERLLKARNHGLRNREDCEFWSTNSRLDELQAALLSVELAHLDRATEERRRLAFRYNDQLKGVVEVPLEGAGEFCVYQTYMIQADRRDDLKLRLNENGVQAAIHYPRPIPLQAAAKDLNCRVKDTPVTIKTASRILSLPLFPGMTGIQQEHVIDLIKGFYES